MSASRRDPNMKRNGGRGQKGKGKSSPRARSDPGEDLEIEALTDQSRKLEDQGRPAAASADLMMNFAVGLQKLSQVARNTQVPVLPGSQRLPSKSKTTLNRDTRRNPKRSSTDTPVPLTTRVTRSRAAAERSHVVVTQDHDQDPGQAEKATLHRTAPVNVMGAGTVPVSDSEGPRGGSEISIRKFGFKSAAENPESSVIKRGLDTQAEKPVLLVKKETQAAVPQAKAPEIHEPEPAQQLHDQIPKGHLSGIGSSDILDSSSSGQKGKGKSSPRARSDPGEDLEIEALTEQSRKLEDQGRPAAASADLVMNFAVGLQKLSWVARNTCTQVPVLPGSQPSKSKTPASTSTGLKVREEKAQGIRSRNHLPQLLKDFNTSGSPRPHGLDHSSREGGDAYGGAKGTVKQDAFMPQFERKPDLEQINGAHANSTTPTRDTRRNPKRSSTDTPVPLTTRVTRSRAAAPAERSHVVVTQDHDQDPGQAEKVTLGTPPVNVMGAGTVPVSVHSMPDDAAAKSNSTSESTSSDDNYIEGLPRADAGTELEFAIRHSEVPVSEFHDFNSLRSQVKYEEGQVWAFYDDLDGMPRFYGCITKVYESPFKIFFVWLEPTAETVENRHSLSRAARESLTGYHFSITCGVFVRGNQACTLSDNIFSHFISQGLQMKQQQVQIFPREGQVWAIYRTFNVKGKGKGEVSADEEDAELNQPFEFVEVHCDQFYDVEGVKVAKLVKTDGFRFVYHRMPGIESMRVYSPAEMGDFSHSVRCKKVAESRTLGVPPDAWELDPACLI